MSLRLTNTLTRQTELFRSLLPNQVSIYCCGVTVYDLCHIGHARSYIVWDVLRRYLIWSGYKVTFVQNFTDIDDKILNRASKEGSTMHEVSERNIQEFYKDMDALGIMRADRMPRATKCIVEIRSLIEELEAKGSAYSIDGDVYFSVMKQADYGKLSGRNLEEQYINADKRMHKSEGSKKNHSYDFALWKSAKKGEAYFPSKWGNGRPGWHIECSAMVKKELGDTIDIHLGGTDLIFPHHENEIAQSQAATGKELARYWLHNGMVNVGGEKMSKSLGNFTTIRDLLDKGVSAMTIRFFVLQAHYKKPLDFSDEALKSASKGWKGLNSALSLGTNHGEILGWSKSIGRDKEHDNPCKEILEEELNQFHLRFINAMDDDLNTSGALAVVFDLARPLRALNNQIERREFSQKKSDEIRTLYKRWTLLTKLSNVLGLKPEKPMNLSSKKDNNIEDQDIENAIAQRKKAKSEKDYIKADNIRELLQKQGIELIDKQGGITEWIRI